MARKLTGAITSVDRFLWCFERAVKKYGWECELLINGLVIPHKKLEDVWVNGYSIYHQEVNKALLSPFCVVWEVWCRKANEPHRLSTCAAEAMGLSGKDYKRIERASAEAPGHNTELRAQLLDAAGLKEIPHKRRRQVCPIA